MSDPGDDPTSNRPAQAKPLATLRRLCTKDLIKQHDFLVEKESPPANVDYYLSELDRRESTKRQQTMLRLTALIAVLTVVNVAAVAVGLLVR